MKTEKRKAKVGERILITDGHDINYRNGDIGIVLDRYGDLVEAEILGKCGAYVYDWEYEVIVDETEADNVGIIEKMQAELEALKERVRVLEQIEKKRVDDEVYNEYLNGNLDDIIENSIKEARKWEAQIKRDEIIEKAKRDVAEILGEYDSFKMTIGRFNDQSVTAKFVVNSKKRTIVALIYGYFTKKLYYRGIAKCAPDDCFNVHIGKAIALRRALGLEVLDEYLNAPQPTEVRVGDIVKWPHSPWIYEVISTEKPYGNLLGFNLNGTRFTADGGDFEGAKIIDDSRADAKQEVTE